MRVEGSLDLFEAVDLYNGVGITTTLSYSLTDDTGTIITPGTGNSYTLIIEEDYTIVLNFNCAIMYEGVYTVTLPEEIEVTADYETTLTISENNQTYLIGKYISETGNQVVRFEIDNLYNFGNIFIDGNICFAVVERQDFNLFGGANIHVDLP
ncbi:MAG: hypothetical protein LIO42_07230, partial [Oscillospiraceae bacterium]|nr:hypothetical protein [Oscillospiraceae bacterium]